MFLFDQALVNNEATILFYSPCESVLSDSQLTALTRLEYLLIAQGT